MHSVDWDIFRLIIAVADRGSAVGAADALNINASTVLRRIARFEEANGVRLFDRHQSGYTPTLQGSAVVETARLIEQHVSDISRDILGSDLRLEGALSVTTTDTFLESLLAPLLPEFRQRHPMIKVDVTATSDRLNLTRHDADIALRASRQPPDSLIGQRISDLGFCVYATSDLIPKKKGELTAKDCRKGPWIGIGEALAGSPVGQWLAANVDAESIALSSDTFLTIRACASEGAGFAVLPCCLGDRYPGLQRVLGPIEEMKSSLWLLTHEGYRNTARVRAFMDFVAPALRAKRPQLEGTV